MDQSVVIKKHADNLERGAWFLTLFGMLTQLSGELQFPSYNVALGLWGAYSAYSKHGRATFGFITFSFVGIVLDITFCATNHAKTTVFQFCLAMLIFCILIKVYALYHSAQFFASIGGAYSLESSNLQGSMYDSLAHSTGSASAAYYPPDNNDMESSTRSFTADNGRGNASLVDSGTF